MKSLVLFDLHNLCNYAMLSLAIDTIDSNLQLYLEVCMPTTTLYYSLDNRILLIQILIQK